MQYGEMFGITAIVCIIGAILALLISGRNEHADAPAVADVEGDDSPTQMVDAPTHPPSGRHRPSR
jgi:hypothetical protein